MMRLFLYKSAPRAGLVAVKKVVKRKKGTHQQTYHVRPKVVDVLGTIASIEKQHGKQVGKAVREFLRGLDPKKPLNNVPPEIGGAMLGHGIVRTTNDPGWHVRAWVLTKKGKALVHRLINLPEKPTAPRGPSLGIQVQTMAAMQVEDAFDKLSHTDQMRVQKIDVAYLQKREGGWNPPLWLGPPVASATHALRRMDPLLRARYISDVSRVLKGSSPLIGALDNYSATFRSWRGNAHTAWNPNIANVLATDVPGMVSVTVQLNNEVFMEMEWPVQTVQAFIKGDNNVRPEDRGRVEAAMQAVLAGEAAKKVVPDQGEFYTPNEIIMAKGKLIKKAPLHLNGGVNKIFLDSFEFKKERVVTVWKPSEGEKIGLRMGALAHDRYYLRERAVYEVDRILGFNTVPTTLVRKVEGDIGSVQEWVVDTETGVEHPDWSVQADPQQIQNIAALDYITYSMDRHPNNLLINTKTLGLSAIDNGLSLPDDERTADELGYFKSDPYRFCSWSTPSPDLIKNLKTVDWMFVKERILKLGLPQRVAEGVEKRGRFLTSFLAKHKAWPPSPGAQI